MARSKTDHDVFRHDDDDDTSSDEMDADHLAERVAEPSRKRMRRTKHSAIYGIFGDDDNERDGGVRRTVRATDSSGRKIDYRAGQAFVRASTSAQAEEAQDTQDQTGSNSTHSSSVQDDRDARQDDFHPASFYSTRPGIGSSAARESSTPCEQKSVSKRSAARAGIGASSCSSSIDTEAQACSRQSGLTSLSMFVSAGSTKACEPSYSSQPRNTIEPSAPSRTSMRDPSLRDEKLETEEREMSASGLPTSFTTPQRPVTPSSTFQRARKAEVAVPKTTIKFGAKFDPSAYLASMGWTGGGLGRSGQGIVKPIEVQVRPERAGIAYGGIKEKTSHAKAEARRRGEAGSSDQEQRQRKRSQGEPEKAKPEAKAWTKASTPKSRKPKIEHRTYEEIIAEIGALPTTHSTVGKIYDASSGVLREVEDLASALKAKRVPTSAATELPELQHNLRLICENNAQSLSALAREGAQLKQRRTWLTSERERAIVKKKEEEMSMQKVRGALQVVKRFEAVAKRIGDGEVGLDGGESVLEEFTPLIEQLQREYDEKQILQLALDQAVVEAITPALRAIWCGWKPLEQPRLTSRYLCQWKALLPNQDSVAPSSSSATMTPFDALLWTYWMPRVRTCLSTFSARRPASAIDLVEAWRPVLARFMFDNVIDQLIVPRLSRSVAACDAPTSMDALEQIVFPWLAVLGVERLAEVLTQAKQRLRSALKMCSISQGPSRGLRDWSSLYTTAAEWEALLLSSLVPRLSAYLKRRLTISAGETQDMTPLVDVLKWSKVVGATVMESVVASDFFAKWLDVLCAWLKSEVHEWVGMDEWYLFWRRWWSENVGGGEVGFAIGLDVINAALDMTADERSKLKTPPFAHTASTAPSTPSGMPIRTLPQAHVSLRDVLAERLAQHDLLLTRSSQVHATGVVGTANIWRISSSPTSRTHANKSSLIYIHDHVVFQHDPALDSWCPVSIDHLINSMR